MALRCRRAGARRALLLGRLGAALHDGRAEEGVEAGVRRWSDAVVMNVMNGRRAGALVRRAANGKAVRVKRGLVVVWQMCRRHGACRRCG